MDSSVRLTAEKAKPKLRKKKPVQAALSEKGSAPAYNAILDAAERLFAERGFDGVSLRDIAQDAQVKLSLIDYYIGNKEDTFQSVIARRADILNKLRTRRLQDLREREAASIEDVLKAFLSPYLDVALAQDPGWRAYIRLIGQLAQTNRWLFLIEKFFNATTVSFVDELCRVEPTVPRLIMARCMEFTIHIMLGVFTENRRIEGLSNNEIKADRFDEAYDHMIPFLAAGVRGLIAKSGAQANHRTKKAP